MRKEAMGPANSRNHEGIRLFADVSSSYPASITAQAASVALYCKEQGKTTEILEDLIGDKSAIRSIRMAAKIRHKQAGVKMKGPTNENVLYILDAVSSLATRMMKLETDELHTILRLYPKDVHKEYEYRKSVEEIWLSPRF